MQLPISFERYFAQGNNYLYGRKGVVKRIMDIVFSLSVILLIFPIIFPVIAACIMIDSSGPIFFVQKRVGYRQRVFNCLKFRTMVHKDKEGRTVVTRVGSILRNTGLDELPQLFNVLIGDMSVVGPRPYSLQDNQQFGRQAAYFNLRYQVRPGITGLAQTEGYKGWIRTEKEIKERTAIDLMYVSHHTTYGDLKIMFRSFVFLVVELFKSLWKR